MSKPILIKRFTKQQFWCQLLHISHCCTYYVLLILGTACNQARCNTRSLLASSNTSPFILLFPFLLSLLSVCIMATRYTFKLSSCPFPSFVCSSKQARKRKRFLWIWQGQDFCAAPPHSNCVIHFIHQPRASTPEKETNNDVIQNTCSSSCL